MGLQVTFQGQIAKVETMRDRSVKVVIETASEITDPIQLASLFSLGDKLVGVGLKEGSISDEEMKDIEEPTEDFRGEKSPGQRLRGALWAWYEQKGKPGEFQDFYRKHMDRLIEQIKEKLL